MGSNHNLQIVDLSQNFMGYDNLAHDFEHCHNCATCHHHDLDASRLGVKSIVKKIHEHNGHQCTDPGCNIEAPHGHNLLDENHKCNHHDSPNKHTHDDHHHGQSFPTWPLENYIAHSKLPQWLKEFFLNASFLSPALISTNFLSNLPLPRLFKTWISITAMHGFNRGKDKLARLGLTYLVSGAASLGSKTNIGAKFTRFLATSLIAIIEKFASNGHNHKKEKPSAAILNELKVLGVNIKDTGKWKELLPSLLNIETKVQIVAPFIKFIIDKTLDESVAKTKNYISTVANILLTSIGFVGIDQMLQKIAKPLLGDQVASSIGAMCGCCGSPVCSAAATDAALIDSI